jgi:hypothetical protein
MESICKKYDKNVVNQGITVYGNKGSTDHFQLGDGLKDFFVIVNSMLKSHDYII